MTKRPAKATDYSANRCPPAHVRRLAKIGCPMDQMIRISGYTQEQIEKMINDK